ncbi:MAG: hypothetical protein WCW78_02860 [Candidatus Paceibacterota bacterium]|jgi:hypothetical protein
MKVLKPLLVLLILFLLGIIFIPLLKFKNEGKNVPSAFYGVVTPTSQVAKEKEINLPTSSEWKSYNLDGFEFKSNVIRGFVTVSSTGEFKNLDFSSSTR